jgi:hypothetical protein
VTSDWFEIRSLRAKPPALAAVDDDRRSVFTSALAQSEALFGAAPNVGPATSPLLLFYGLSQAGRALAAAYDTTDAWRISGHGFSVRTGTSIENTMVTAAPKVGPGPNDALSAASRALASELPQGGSTLQELWASIPELLPLPHLRGRAAAAIEVRPDGLNPLGFPALTPAHGNVVLSGIRERADIDRALTKYARTAGYEVLVQLPAVNGWASVTLTWPDVAARGATAGSRAVRPLHEIALRVGPRWYLQPLVGEPRSAPDHLLLWWQLLIGLSQLARYQPEVWTAALDVNESPIAVELEAALDLVHECVPRLLSAALRPPLERSDGPFEATDL